ncbi:endolytic transglycosylase MltG [Streptococcus cameli]
MAKSVIETEEIEHTVEIQSESFSSEEAESMLDMAESEHISENTVEATIPSESLLGSMLEMDSLVESQTEERFDFLMQEEESISNDELEDTIIAPMPSKKQTEKQTATRSRRNSRDRGNRKKQEALVKRIVTIIISVVLLAIAITGFTGYTYVKTSLEPVNEQSTQNIQIQIPEGSTTKDIGNILVENKLIKNATIFNYYAKLKSYNNFQSGYYNLNQSMSVDEIAKALQETGAAIPQDPIAGKVLIIEGYTLEQMGSAVTDNVYTDDKDDKTPFTKEAFLETVQNPEFIQSMVQKYPNLLASLPSKESGVRYQLEGYLFPATYEYSEKTTVEELVEKMIAAMDANLQAYYGVLSNKGLDVNALLTMASLVEKEGATDEDRRNIASVFYNRINTGMPLQSNIAILYAMGKLGEKTTLAEDAGIDTGIDSPYNIYIHTGLMPGAVASPSLAAIEATVNPNKTDYYYFVADVTTGTIYYSVTLEEHNQKVEQYVNSKLSE